MLELAFNVIKIAVRYQMHVLVTVQCNNLNKIINGVDILHGVQTNSATPHYKQIVQHYFGKKSEQSLGKSGFTAQDNKLLDEK